MNGLLTDVGAAVADPGVWSGLAIATIAAAMLILIGVPIARRIGLLDPPGSGDMAITVGVGLSVGLVAVAAGWATVASGFRSVFVPVAAFLLLAIAAGPGRPTVRVRLDGASIRAAGALAGCLILIGLLYASTLAPSPRHGSQPVEFFDVGFYSVLGADLAKDGTESVYSPGGVHEMGASVPDQTWYHWGELWLAALAVDATGLPPILARHVVVLPILVVATAATVGAVARRIAAPGSNESFVIGAAAMLFLAPIPILRDVDVEWFARSTLLGITQYGLAMVVIVLGIHALISARLRPTIPGALVGAALIAALIATHIGIAAIVSTALAVYALMRMLPVRRASAVFDRSTASIGAVVTASAGLTIAWGYLTGHGLGGLGAIEGISAFDWAWGRAVVETTLGAGVVLVGPIVAIRSRDTRPALRAIAVGALAGAAFASLAWGALVADLNTFHLFFGSVAAVLTPIAVILAISLLARARQDRRRAASTLLLTAILCQTAISAGLAGIELRAFGALDYEPTPVRALARLRDLPAGSKAAYGCDATENFAPWDYSLISIEAHTGVRLVPLCFVADRPRRILGRDLDPAIESPFFRVVPQRDLYTDVTARPTVQAIDSFARSKGIEYIYTDSAHSDTLVPATTRLFREGHVAVYRLRAE